MGECEVVELLTQASNLETPDSESGGSANSPSEQDAGRLHRRLYRCDHARASQMYGEVSPGDQQGWRDSNPSRDGFGDRPTQPTLTPRTDFSIARTRTETSPVWRRVCRLTLLAYVGMALIPTGTKVGTPPGAS